MILWRWRETRVRAMRGEDRVTGALFSYVDVEARIPGNHPLLSRST